MLAFLRHSAAALACIGFTTGCSALQSVEATEVPGAAATAARSSRTAIPEPAQSPAVAIPSPAAVRAQSAVPLPSQSPAPDLDAALARAAISRMLSSPELPGLEQLLLARVSLSTPEGGEVLDRAAAATWLRDHAGPNTHLVTFSRSQISAMAEVTTEGWSPKPPVAIGRITFGLHRYNAAGQADEDHGDWIIDVVSAE